MRRYEDFAPDGAGGPRIFLDKLFSERKVCRQLSRQMKESKISCPLCGGHLVFPIELAGQETLCPHCNKPILLPPTKSKAAWFFIITCVAIIACVVSIILWKHTTKSITTPIANVAKNSASKPVSLQKDPLATGQLMAAIQYDGNVETVKLLLEKGANVNAKDNEGWHPLQLAAKRGDLEIVGLLLKNGANVNATNNYGVTALASAAYRGYTDIAKLLIEKGADVNARENNKATALMVAAGAGQVDSVKLLLEKGADINATNEFGDSVLMAAVNGDKTDTVKFLLSKGASIQLEDGLGMNALDDAKRNGNMVIVKLLQQAGATKSSWAKQDEEMANNLQKLQESTAALSNSWQNLQQASVNIAIASDKTAFEVLKITAKPTEQNNVWWRYGYRLTVRNNTSNNSRQFFEIQFLDSEGYVIDTKTERAAINPGATDVITGETLINLPGATRVAKLKAIWNP